MRKNHRRALPLLLLPLGLLWATAARAQAPTVRGTVLSSDNGQPLRLVNVMIKGTRRGTSSDVAGHFTLPVRSLQDTLVFSLLGYGSRTVPLSGQSQLEVRLEVEAVQAEALVVTGYRAQEKATVTGAVTQVKGSEFQDMPVDNLSNALAGRLSGVSVTQDAGTPGMESSIRIRSVGTFNNTDPLYVIDGTVRDKATFDQLSTDEIASISILKDGASGSIYGSRAANGVVLVTTKRGGVSAPAFTYTARAGVYSPTMIPPTLNAFQQATLIDDYLSYNNVPQTDARWYAPDELDYFKTHSFDWIQQMWKRPLNVQQSLSMTGGTPAVKYYLSGSYLTENGSFANLDYNRLTTRANVDVNVTDRLKVSADLSTALRKRKGPSWGGNDWSQSDLYKALDIRSRMVPAYIDGLPVGNWVEWHPGAVIDGTAGYDHRDWGDYTGRLRLEYQVPRIDGLSANLTYFKGHTEGHRKDFNLDYQMAMFNTLGTHNHIVGDSMVGWKPRSATQYLLQTDSVDDNYQLDAQVNYRRLFGEHSIDGLLVFEQAAYDRVYFNGQRNNFISPTIDQFIGGSNDPKDQTANGWQQQSARLSYVGSLAYNYARKYFLQGSFRYDGSVIFSPERRWGFFPSLSGGWRISQEPFFRVPFVNDLKLRGSYGVVGNDNVGSFQWQQAYSITNGAVFSAPTVGLVPGALANPLITWEKSRSYNVGVDSRLWNHVTVTLDAFKKHGYDILGSRSATVPGTFGASLPDENYEVVDAHGFEAELGYDGSAGRASAPVSYYVRGNFGYATNKIVALNEAQNIRPYQSRIGRPTSGRLSDDDACFGYVASGILRTQADIDALPSGYTILGVKPQLGMMNYKDLRGPTSDDPDGKITSDDRKWICDHTLPPINYGLGFGVSWKSLAVDAQLHGAAGNKVIMTTNGRDMQGRAEESDYGYWADHWTPDNPNARYPGYFAAGYRTRSDPSTFWMRNGSFLRLKTVTVSYLLPERLTTFVGASNARLYVTGNNLWLLQYGLGDWGFDPEASDIRAYPVMKTFEMGVNFTLKKRS